MPTTAVVPKAVDVGVFENDVSRVLGTSSPRGALCVRIRPPGTHVLAVTGCDKTPQGQAVSDYCPADWTQVVG